MSGWKLSTALITKHFGKLGDTLAEALANFDPETATEVDRENLQNQMRGVASRLATARRAWATEQKEADDLSALIANDTNAASILSAKLSAGEIDEATVNEFLDELEASKARLPIEKQEAAEAKELVDTLQEILSAIESRLADFDRQAKAALREIQNANAEKDRQDLRLQHQQEMRSLKEGLGGASTALGALTRRANALRSEADASKIIADIGQKPLERSAAVEEARRLAAGNATPAKESAAERLRRLMGDNTPA